MRKVFLVIAVLIIIILLLFYSSYNPKQIEEVYFGEVTVKVEVADSSEEIREGLMYREELGEKEGMLFIFQDERERNFWMKNTLIPLDMIFLDKDKKIVHIVKNAEPCSEEECQLYNSRYSSKYVIEVNAGFADKHNIEVGDFIEF